MSIMCRRGCLPGLIEDTEEKELKGLVEERVKALHFRAPQVPLCAASSWHLPRTRPCVL